VGNSVSGYDVIIILQFYIWNLIENRNLGMFAIFWGLLVFFFKLSVMAHGIMLCVTFKTYFFP